MPRSRIFISTSGTRISKDAATSSLFSSSSSLLTLIPVAMYSPVFILHDHGVQKPNYRAMTECLKEMLTLPSQGPTYIILDALDGPNTSGIPSPWKEVLALSLRRRAFTWTKALIAISSIASHCFDALPNIGSSTRNLGMSRHGSRMVWIVRLMRTNHTLPRGSGSSTKMMSIVPFPPCALPNLR
jgi:hypothetical protein